MIDTPKAKAYRYKSLPAGEPAPGRAAGFMTAREWVADTVAALPWLWRDALQKRWDSKREHEPSGANLDVLVAARELMDSQRAGLRPDAGDQQIRARARVMAGHFREGLAKRLGLDAVAWAVGSLVRDGLAQFWPCGWGEKPRCTLSAGLARLKCRMFWSRALRRLFAKTVERCSIGLGLVNKAAQLYVSDMSVTRRGNQLRSSREAMQRTELENEYGQRVKLADLAAKSTSNKAVRRAELMTRISGFDVVAQGVGHEATFITVTCPSAMHKFTDRGRHGVAENPKFNGSTPGQAQAYLSGQWAKCRAWLQRRNVELYGFRVAEPHHDGCPHWHFLLFHPAEASEVLQAGFLRYFLHNAAPTERGAAQHRVKFERIDRSKGSAAAYLAKYIAKNVDGYGVGEDLFGSPAVESSRRVDAWASTWGIRQFQQLGGAPVGVWRELRRINPEELPGDLLPRELTDSMAAVNIKDDDAGAKWADGWATYTRSQGGPCVHRDLRPIKLLKRPNGEINRYEEARPDDVVGVACAGRNWHKPAHMVAMLGELRAPSVPRPAAAQIESERAQWRVVGEGEALPLGAAGRPWTRVNNCTQTLVETPAGARSVSIVHRSKLGRWRPLRPVEPAPGSPPASNWSTS